MSRVLAIAALLCAVIVPALASQRAVALPAKAEFPVLSGRVVDDADVLDPATRTRLREKLVLHELKTSDQIVVATVKSLGDSSIEDYANRLFRHWQLGQRGRNNGVLLLHAPTERKVRIEVGYGLEGRLTDAMTRSIIQNAITPRFKAGDFAGGMLHGVDEIIGLLARDGEEFGKRSEPLVPSWLTKAPATILPAVFIFLPIVFFILLQKSGFLPPLPGISPALARKARRKYAWSGDESRSDSSWSSSGSLSGSSGSSSSGSSSGSSDSFSSGGGDSGGGGSSGDY
jgi:uncharacterized protein